ncbi:Immediate-early protein 2 [Streptomyces sp. CC53]|uniref:SRPBCC family protein n=1 Tax=unclassified Streptomyces TaxID=2593676 RepID=UPI0008DE86CD|nr:MULTISPECIES: SRPBCC family protein [unclassified Streptomyces]OII65626.1 Immediate-early protein 2 [Streptomyces sp. CC53]
MGVFRVERVTALSPDEAWRRITDWRVQAAQVPLTRLASVSPGPTCAGTRFTMRTGVGPVAFDDPMAVVRWEPPEEAGGTRGVCRVEKYGRVVGGWAELTVRAEGAGTRVTWVEELRPWGVPGWCDPLLDAGARRVFGRALRRVLDGGRGARRPPARG